MASIKNIKIYKKKQSIENAKFYMDYFMKKLEILKYTENSN